VVKRANRPEQIQAFGIRSAVVDGERVGGERPRRHPRLIRFQQIARQAMQVDEREEERRERDAQRDVEPVLAEEVPDRPDGERKRGKKHDVLLPPRIAIPRVAFGHDRQVPAGVPARREIEKLVIRHAEPDALRREADGRDAQVADEQHRSSG
jgi:hypothetical protein